MTSQVPGVPAEPAHVRLLHWTYRIVGGRRLRWDGCGGHDRPPGIGDKARTVAHAIDPNPA